MLPGIGWTLLPFFGIPRVKRRMQDENLDSLLTLRATFLAFAMAIVHIGVVVAIFAAGEGFEGGDLRAAPVAWGVAALGIGSVVAVRAFDRLDCSSEPALFVTYRTRFFLRLAFAETAALVGFLGFLITGEPLVYVVGAAFAAVGFRLAAPSAGNLARDQYRLNHSGCPHNLVALLRSVHSAPEQGE